MPLKLRQQWKFKRTKRSGVFVAIGHKPNTDIFEAI